MTVTLLDLILRSATQASLRSLRKLGCGPRLEG
jgi:hypothetical protein